MSTNETHSISTLLLREMQTRNWSQREMAKACLLSNTTISKIVREQSLPDPNTCFKLATGLALPVHYILNLAGHDIAGAQLVAPSLEAFLHAEYAHLPDRAVQEMLGAIRAIEHAYTTPSTDDLEIARQKLEQAEFMRRWLDPIKRRVLTVVQGGHFVFYQTARLDDDGREREHSELLPIQEGTSSLATFPVYNFANSFCVQLYPLAEFDAQRCRSHQQHAALFTPIYAGDRGTGVRVIFPDGRQSWVRDRAMERVWQRIYNDLSPGQNWTALNPSAEQQARLAQVREQWTRGLVDELWLNPDARTFAAFFAPLENDTSYYLLTGPLNQLPRADKRAQQAERIEIIDTTLYGRFETSVVHLQGFCIRLYPQAEYITATRRIVPAHRTLIWSERQASHVLVFNAYLGAWLHLQIETSASGEIDIQIIADNLVRAEIGRRKLGGQIQTLQEQHISFSDSHLPY